MTGRAMRLFVAMLLALAGLAVALPARAQDESPVALPLVSAGLGDLDEILHARQFRLLVPYNKTHFFFDKGHERGVAAEFGRDFETWLNKRHARKGLPIRVVFVPTARDRLFDALIEGKGDAVSAGLTITQERLRLVDFARPWLTGVDEILVSGPKAPEVARIEDLAGRDLPVRPGTSYREHLEATNRDFVARGLAPIRIVELSPRLQGEDVLQMVAAGLLPWAIADSHIAEHWSRALRGLKTHPDIAFNRDGAIAWALRKDSPKLAAELDAFFAERKAGTAFGSTVLRRYYGGRAAVRDARADDERYDRLVDSFRRHAATNGIDFQLLAAQGFQESRLDQNAISRRGAVGVMQLLPSTAQSPPISIEGVERDADANIRAGAAVMAHLRSRHVNQPGLDEVDRTLMTFAAYNAGPGNLRKFRRKTAAMGLDPDVWFENVEVGAAQIVGAETVNYVSNIYKYYVAYSLALAEARTSREERPASPGRGIERGATSP
jgi:membrane-bound lytic murein transglycosylase MltF